ncbi:MAG: hypothetical protein ABIV47_22800 [Roseiflexaceae bacterium]
MVRNLLKKKLDSLAIAATSARVSLRLQITLWTLWTFGVTGAGYISWYADLVAQRATNVIGLVVQCVMVGLIGLVILTKIEMWREPWRFID